MTAGNTRKLNRRPIEALKKNKNPDCFERNRPAKQDETYFQLSVNGNQ